MVQETVEQMEMLIVWVRKPMTAKRVIEISAVRIWSSGRQSGLPENKDISERIEELVSKEA